MRKAQGSLWGIALLSGVALLLSACGASTKAVTQPHGYAPHQCVLTVDIAHTGSTVWGNIQIVAPSGITTPVTTASQAVDFPCGTALTVKESPAQPTAWPFQKWVINGDSGQYSSTAHTGSSLQLTLKGNTTLTADYVLASTSNGAKSETVAAHGSSSTKSAGGW